MEHPQKGKQKKETDFSEKRNELYKKAEDFSNVTGAQVAIVTFSPDGTPSTFGNPSVDTVVDDYLRLHPSPVPTGEVVVGDNTEKAVGENSSFWWDANVDSIDNIEELERYKSALIDLKEKVITKIEREKKPGNDDGDKHN